MVLDFRETQQLGDTLDFPTCIWNQWLTGVESVTDKVFAVYETNEYET